MANETMDQRSLVNGQTFVWHEVYCADGDKARDFYTQALGFGHEAYPMGDMGTYHMLTRDGVTVGGIMATGGNPQMENIPPHWATYLAVDDVDARLAKCQELGATLVVPPMDVPNIGRMCLIQDPQGAHIWLFKGAS